METNKASGKRSQIDFSPVMSASFPKDRLSAKNSSKVVPGSKGYAQDSVNGDNIPVIYSQKIADR